MLTGYSQALLDIDYPSGTISARYDYGDDLFAQIDSPESSAPEPHYFLYDGLGSTRSLTNNQGAIEQTYNYKPFGERQWPQTFTPQTDHLFTGERFDAETGYYHLRARQYDPRMGRFTSFDPAEDFQNRLHKYVYSGNNSVNHTDVSGMYFSLGQIAITTAISSIVAGIFCGVASVLDKDENTTFVSGFIGGMILGAAVSLLTFAIASVMGYALSVGASIAGAGQGALWAQASLVFLYKCLSVVSVALSSWHAGRAMMESNPALAAWFLAGAGTIIFLASALGQRTIATTVGRFLKGAKTSSGKTFIPDDAVIHRVGGEGIVPDDAFVHVSGAPHSTVEPINGSSCWFRFSTIKYLSDAQYRSAIGAGGRSSMPGGARYLHVVKEMPIARVDEAFYVEYIAYESVKPDMVLDLGGR